MPRHGQMVINMKTTVTTNGSHNGLVVHSAIQGSPSTSSPSPWSPGGFPVNQTLDHRPNGSTYRSSPMPIQMLPSTSQETLNTIHRPLSPPESPTFSFKGRDSPPDEFIQPTKLVLNIFKPFDKPNDRNAHVHSTSSYPLSRSQLNLSDGGIQLSKRHGVLNDAVTTQTTVEVFRAPTSQDLPTISIPASPYNNQPLLIRANGPSCETWQNSRTETALDDRPRVQPLSYPYTPQKGVQWKEKLVENGSSHSNSATKSYDPYEEIVPYVYSLRRDEPPTFSPVSHPVLTNDNGRSPYSPSESSLSYVSALPPYSSSSNLAYRTPNESRMEQRKPIDRPLSPLYVVPDRYKFVQKPRMLTDDSFRTFEPLDPVLNSRGRDPVRWGSQERVVHAERSQERYSRRGPRATKRSKSTDGVRPLRRDPTFGSRDTFGSQEFVSDFGGSTYTLASPNPNDLPGRPASARSQEIFNLYQTRDALNRIVDQL